MWDWISIFSVAAINLTMQAESIVVKNNWWVRFFGKFIKSSNLLTFGM